jgi:two-component system NarL family sensor kinase
MLSTNTRSLIIFVVACMLLILLLTCFITFIIYKYQQKQNAYFQRLEKLKVAHENDMLRAKVEIQEQTFENISREIHDNIGQKLTLAKLHLNTLNFSDLNSVAAQITHTVKVIGEAINDLSDISRSMSSEIILNNGFIKALEFEVSQLNKPGLYSIKLVVTGETVFLEANRELVLFRITQEALNNIVKHANATSISIELHFAKETLSLSIIDNGRGFLNDMNQQGNGLSNMAKRAKMLNGSSEIYSEQGRGTTINIKMPIYENKQSI